MAAGSLSPVAEIAGHTPLAAKIMRPIVRRLSRPGILVWAAPIRALRERCGWRPRPVALSEARSILVIRPDEIGDVVLTSPFLRELRQSAPQARITLLVKPGCYGLVEYCPHVDAVLPFEFGSGGRLPWRVWRFRYRELPWRGFDLVLLPRYDTDWYNSEFVAHCLAGRGCVLAHRKLLPDRVPAWRSLRIYSNPRVEHEAVHPLSFLRWCGGAQIGGTHLEVWPAQEDEAFAARALPAPGKYVALAAGARGRPRRWPAERFAALALRLREQFELIPVSLGAGDDPHFDGGIDMTGRTTLRQAAAVMERCALFVGNDSGLMHVAAAAGTPVVEISAFRRGGNPGHHNSPCRFQPWGVAHRVVQPAAGTGVLAIEEITVEAVQAACSDLLNQAVVPTLATEHSA